MLRSFAAITGLSGMLIAVALLGRVSTSEPATNLNQSSTHVTANVRSFHSPRLEDKIVRYCSAQMRQCGKLVADGFCRSQGFEAALTFQRDRDHIDQTTSFRQIRCWHPTNRSAYNQQVRANVSVFAKNQVFPVSCALNVCLSI
jgi:hypothetical protein